MNYPKVSIQIPTYNQEDFIVKTIESCLMQDYPNLEINIADDNSTDNSCELIKPYLADYRLRYFSNQTNIGRVANYHKALYQYATGEWVINLDGDDYFTDNTFITKAMDAIIALNDPRLFVYQANHDTAKLSKMFPGHTVVEKQFVLINGFTYLRNYHKVLNFTHCATMYRRDQALQYDFYSFDCLFTDFNSIGKLIITGNILVDSKKVAHWNTHQFNATADIRQEQIETEIRAINNLAQFAATKCPGMSWNSWSHRMQSFLLNIYYDRKTSIAEKKNALKFILSHFNFSAMYLKLLVKGVLQVMGLKK